MIQVRFYAGAREAAGVASEARSESTVGDLREGLIRDHPDLEPILGHCAMLVDGSLRPDDHSLDQAELADVLPPFAGG